MMTVADPDLSPSDLRALRSDAGKLMTVPISFSPAPGGHAPPLGYDRFEARKVNGPLTGTS
jgi:hypothetical protein